ncbi:MAG: hypothetical protein A2020_02055 [Lentisphaerae bacterium GWF2_45_14]|nr:MAG: hypothetical protein A2020_02055 [Lentisphaerae bacterium GWF2_45_14]
MLKIVVVDDEKIIRALLQEILKKAGHEVFVTGSADEALEITNEKSPDILITDIFMPEKSGLELIMEVKKSFPSIKTIAISGDSISRAGGHRDCLKLAETLGCQFVLEKPFTRNEVIAAIEKISEISG